MKIAYFTNTYPAISHTFIQREIVALESLGARITRMALRPHHGVLLHPSDKSEAEQTRYVFSAGAPRLLSMIAIEALKHPVRFLRGLATAVTLGLRSPRGVFRHLAYFAEAMVVARWCREDGIPHIHAHFGTNPAAVAMYAADFGGLTYSFTSHRADELDEAIVDMQAKVRKARFVACVAWFVRSQLMRCVPYDDYDKLKVIHCGLDAGFLTAPPIPRPDAPSLICLGRLCEEKSQHLLVEALAKVRDAGHRPRLVLAGDGHLRPLVERVIAQHGLQDQVTITGWIDGDRVKREMAAASIMVLPSLLEGLPVAIMEAMAMGRPVISTYIDGIPELVQPGRTGWLVPAGNVDALADAIIQAITLDAAAMEKLAQNGRERVAERHNIETEARKLLDLFAQVT